MTWNTSGRADSSSFRYGIFDAASTHTVGTLGSYFKIDSTAGRVYSNHPSTPTMTTAIGKDRTDRYPVERSGCASIGLLPRVAPRRPTPRHCEATEVPPTRTYNALHT